VSLIMGAVGPCCCHWASLFHLQSTPQAVACEAEMGGVATGSSSAGLVFCVGVGVVYQ